MHVCGGGEWGGRGEWEGVGARSDADQIVTCGRLHDVVVTACVVSLTGRRVKPIRRRDLSPVLSAAV